MKIRKIAMACLAVGGIAAMGSAAAYLYPDSVNDFRYYSDASMTDLIGGERYECDGTRLRWGTIGGYRVHNHWPCPEDDR